MSLLRDCAIITCCWGGGGVGKLEGGGHMGKITHRGRGGLDVKVNTYWGHYVFHSFSQARKVVEELCSYLLTLELNCENINSRCFDL